MCVYLCVNKHKNIKQMRRENVKQIYVTREVGDRLKKYCEEEGLIMTTYTNRIVDEHLKSLGR